MGIKLVKKTENQTTNTEKNEQKEAGRIRLVSNGKGVTAPQTIFTTPVKQKSEYNAGVAHSGVSRDEYDKNVREAYKKRLEEAQQKAEEAGTESRLSKGSFTGEREYVPSMWERVKNVVEGAAAGYAGDLLSTAGSAIQWSTEKNPANKAAEMFADAAGEKAAGSEMVQAALENEQKQNERNDAAGEQLRNWSKDFSTYGQEQIEQAKTGLGQVGQTIVDTGAAGTQMLMDIGLGALTKLGMAAPMAVRVFGAGTAKAKEDGADLAGQLRYGLGTAAAAYGMEHLFGMAFSGLKIANPGLADDFVNEAINTMAQKMATTPKGATVIKAIASLAASFGGEFAEEFLEAFVEPEIRRLSYDKNAQNVFQDPALLGEMLYEGLIGGILGLFGGGVNVMINTAVESGTDEDLKDAYRQYQSYFTDEAVNEAYKSLQENGMFSAKANEDVQTAKKKLVRILPEQSKPLTAKQRAAQEQYIGANAQETAPEAAGEELTSGQEKTQGEAQNAATQSEAQEPEANTAGQTKAKEVDWSQYPALQRLMETGQVENAAEALAEAVDAINSGALRYETEQAAEVTAENNSAAPAETGAAVTEGATNDEGELRVSGDGGRRTGQSAGGQTGAVSESTGRRAQRAIQNLRARDRADAVAWAYEQAGAGGVSARELFGNELGTEDAVLRPAPGSVIESDKELTQLRNTIREDGYEPVFFTGAAMLVSGQQAAAYIKGDTVFVRIDHPRWTATELWSHEEYHGMSADNPGMVQQQWEEMCRTKDGKWLHKTLETYRKRYHGTYDVDADGNTIWNEEVMLKVIEEILADAYAGRDAFNTGVDRIGGEVRSMTEQRTGRDRQARAPPEGRFAYAGEKAVTADMDALAQAKEMDSQDVAAETIRQQTGWFKGTDGKWRFEIDDSKMRYERRGDLGFRQRHEGYNRYRELNGKAERAMLGLSDERLTAEEQQELTDLRSTWGNTFRTDGKVAPDALATTKLADYIDHPELFAAYPQLEEASLVFAKLPEGTRGQYDTERNTIRVSEDLRHAPQETLLHEIQHAIQQIEGFSGGASVEYWEDQQRAGRNKTRNENAIREANQQYREFFDAAPDELKQTVREINRAKMAKDWDTVMALEDEVYDGPYADIYGELEDLDFARRMLIEQNEPISAKELYRNTAGEIEARDTAKRKDLTADERKKTATDLGGKDTVFAEGRFAFSDTEIERTFLDYNDTEATANAVAETADDIRREKNDVAVNWTDVEKYASAIDWSKNNQTAARKFVQNILTDVLGNESVKFSIRNGTVVAHLTGNGKNHYTNYATPQKAALAEKVRELISTARYAYSTQHDKHSKSGNTKTGRPVWDNFVAVAQIDGGPYDGETVPFVITTREIDSDQRAQIYDMHIKTEMATSHEGVPAEAGSRSNYGGFTISADKIAQKGEVVKDGRFAVDEAETTERPWWKGEDEETREAAQIMAERAKQKAQQAPAFDIDEYLNRKKQEADAARTERLRNIPKSEFKATENLEKLGVKIEGSVANYTDVEQIKARHKAARSVKQELRKAEKRLRATAAEKTLASDIASGAITEEMIGRNVDKDKVLELADYYMAERAQGVDMIRQRRAEINRTLDERMGNLFKNLDKYKVSPILIMNNRTPQRNMLKIFGGEMGQKINEEIFDPVATNEAERIRFVNREYDKVRTFRDSSGKESKLSKDERALVQMVIEGRAVEEIVAGMEISGAIKSVAEDINNGKDASDAAQQYKLDAKEQDLAKKYARWMQAQEALHSGNVDNVKVENAANTYSKLFDQYYEAINDFLVVHGYEPIGFIKGYAPHLQPEENSKLLDKALEAMGINRNVTNLPTEIAGRTSDFKPNKRWNPYFLQRNGGETEYDIATAFESYVDHLSDVLFHTDDIMRVRRMERFFRKTFSKEELRNEVEWAEGLRDLKPEEKLDALREAGKVSRSSSMSPDDVSAAIDEIIEESYSNMEDLTRYGEFVMWLENYANILAGKQSMVDRGGEAGGGRRVLNWGNALTGMFGKAQVAGNLSSVLNQTSQMPLILAENGIVNTMQAAKDIMNGNLRRAFVEESDALTGKAGIDFIVRTPNEMVINALFTPAQMMDSMLSTMAVRGAYLKAVKSGMSHEAAMKAADKYGRNVMGSREKGTKPLGFHAKNPISQLAHVFQLEALNSWEHISRDLPRDFKQIETEKGKKAAVAALVGVVIKTLLSAFLLNRLTEEAYGGTPAPFDILGMSSNFIASGRGLSTNEWLMTMIDNAMEQMTGERFFDTEEIDKSDAFDWEAATADLRYNLYNEIPFVSNVSGLLGLGDNTLPWPDVWGAGKDLAEAVAEDGLISGRTAQRAAEFAGEFIPGGRQITKTIGGIQSAVRGGKATGYGDEKTLQFPTSQTPLGIARQVLFGVNATPEARSYWASGESKLSVKQTQLWERLVDSGANSQAVYDVIQSWRNVSNDKELDSTTRGKLQRNMVSGMDLTDRQKLDMYRTLSGADSRCDKFEAMMNAGMTWDEVMRTYDKYEQLDNNAALKASEQAAQFVKWAYSNLSTREANAAVQQLAFWTTMKASPSQAQLEEELNKTKLTDNQKTAIWNSYGWKKESPWS